MGMYSFHFFAMMGLLLTCPSILATMCITSGSRRSPKEAALCFTALSALLL